MAEWVKSRPEHFIKNDDADTQAIFIKVAQAIMDGDYNPGHRESFLSKGDPWIIAKAKLIGATVVTHESFVVAGSKKVKVPNICQQFDIPCMNTFQFLRELKAQFILAS